MAAAARPYSTGPMARTMRSTAPRLRTVPRPCLRNRKTAPRSTWVRRVCLGALSGTREPRRHVVFHLQRPEDALREVLDHGLGGVPARRLPAAGDESGARGFVEEEMLHGSRIL